MLVERAVQKSEFPEFQVFTPRLTGMPLLSLESTALTALLAHQTSDARAAAVVTRRSAAAQTLAALLAAHGGPSFSL